MLVHADVLQIPLQDKSVQCCVTSPPYWGLRDYGIQGQLGLEKTPAEYVTQLVEAFREVRRVLLDNGTLWLNLGSSYSGAGYSNNKNTGGATRGQGGKQKHSYVSRSTKFKQKDLVPIPWMVAIALQADGWYLRSDIIWAKPNPMPESVTDRPTKAHEYMFLLAKSRRYFYDADAVREPCVDGNPRGRNKRDVWTVATRPYKDAHFAVFPEALIEPCILAGCPVGGVVFDPFVGSGTTTLVAERLGRVGVGLDLSREYLEMARRSGA